MTSEIAGTEICGLSSGLVFVVSISELYVNVYGLYSLFCRLHVEVKSLSPPSIKVSQ